MEHFNYHTARLGLLCERKKRNNAKEPPWETGEAFFDAWMRVGMLPAEAEKAVRQTTMGRSLALSAFASVAGKVFHCRCITSARRNLPRRSGGAMFSIHEGLRQIHHPPLARNQAPLLYLRGFSFRWTVEDGGVGC